jgi:hypothetical protein
MRRNRSQFPIAALDANPRALHEDVAIGEKSQKKNVELLSQRRNFARINSTLR